MEVEVALRAAAVIAAAAAVGQVVCRRLPIPLPVFLLAVGMGLGQDGLNVVQTARLGSLAAVTVSLSVALIVFEGAGEQHSLSGGGAISAWRRASRSACPRHGTCPP